MNLARMVQSLSSIADNFSVIELTWSTISSNDGNFTTFIFGLEFTTENACRYAAYSSTASSLFDLLNFFTPFLKGLYHKELLECVKNSKILQRAS